MARKKPWVNRAGIDAGLRASVMGDGLPGVGRRGANERSDRDRRGLPPLFPQLKCSPHRRLTRRLGVGGEMGAGGKRGGRTVPTDGTPRPDRSSINV